MNVKGAFEAAAGFSDKLLHGEAISLGIVCAFEFSTRLGLLSTNDAAAMKTAVHTGAPNGKRLRKKSVPGITTAVMTSNHSGPFGPSL